MHAVGLVTGRRNAPSKSSMLPMTNQHVAAGEGVVGADAVEEEPILAVGAMLAAPSEAPHHEVMAEDHDHRTK